MRKLIIAAAWLLIISLQYACNDFSGEVTESLGVGDAFVAGGSNEGVAGVCAENLDALPEILPKPGRAALRGRLRRVSEFATGDCDREAVANAEVRLIRNVDAEAVDSGEDTAEPSVLTVTTDSSGYYKTDSLLPGEYTLFSSVEEGSGGIGIQDRGIVADEGGYVARPPSDMTKTGTIVGVAYLYNNDGGKLKDHEGIRIYIPGTSLEGITDSRGNYSIMYVPMGFYRLTAEKPLTTGTALFNKIHTEEFEVADPESPTQVAEIGLTAETDVLTTTDTDGDGSFDALDCNPDDPNIHPNATEVLDGVDNDCDTLIDEGTVVYDDDGDGLSETEGDCNDANSAVWQYLIGFTDIDGDGLGTGTPLQVCSGVSLPVPPAVATNYADNALDCDDSDATAYQYLSGYRDIDRDGFGAGALTSVCTDNELPIGYSSNASDCNDIDDTLYQYLFGFQDLDGDLFGSGNVKLVCSGDTLATGYVDNNFDCNDTDSTKYEILLGFVDADEDGFGYGKIKEVCSGAGLPSGYADNDADCNDASDAIHPGPATMEIAYDQTDNDCNPWTFDDDLDYDGYCKWPTNNDAMKGFCDPTKVDCNDDPNLDPEAPFINPRTAEQGGNAIDENCDGFASDQDSDGYNSVTDTSNYNSQTNSDCDDTNKNIYPNAPELLNGIDDDCDSIEDDEVDDDLDGYADHHYLYDVLLDEGVDVTLFVPDCDDTDAAINPDPLTVEDDTNLVDENCDGLFNVVDGTYDALENDKDDCLEIWAGECVTGQFYHRDGWAGWDSGWPSTSDDCDSTSRYNYPGGIDLPFDNTDQNCDGAALDILTEVDTDGVYVDAVNGDDDSGDGTAANPYRTIDQAYSDAIETFYMVNPNYDPTNAYYGDSYIEWQIRFKPIYLAQGDYYPSNATFFIEKSDPIACPWANSGEWDNGAAASTYYCIGDVTDFNYPLFGGFDSSTLPWSYDGTKRSNLHILAGATGPAYTVRGTEECGPVRIRSIDFKIRYLDPPVTAIGMKVDASEDDVHLADIKVYGGGATESTGTTSRTGMIIMPGNGEVRIVDSDIVGNEDRTPDIQDDDYNAYAKLDSAIGIEIKQSGTIAASDVILYGNRITGTDNGGGNATGILIDTNADVNIYHNAVSGAVMQTVGLGYDSNEFVKYYAYGIRVLEARGLEIAENALIDGGPAKYSFGISLESSSSSFEATIKANILIRGRAKVHNVQYDDQKSNRVTGMAINGAAKYDLIGNRILGGGYPGSPTGTVGSGSLVGLRLENLDGLESMVLGNEITGGYGEKFECTRCMTLKGIYLAGWTSNLFLTSNTIRAGIDYTNTSLYYSGNESFGIYVDQNYDSSGWVNVTNNIINGGGVSYNSPEENRNHSSFAMHFEGNSPSPVISNNTILPGYTPDRNGKRITEAVAVRIMETFEDGMEFDNNLVYQQVENNTCDALVAGGIAEESEEIYPWSVYQNFWAGFPAPVSGDGSYLYLNETTLEIDSIAEMATTFDSWLFIDESGPYYNQESNNTTWDSAVYLYDLPSEDPYRFDWMPVDGSSIVDALSSFTLAEKDAMSQIDYFGNQREDGSADIGAVEFIDADSDSYPAGIDCNDDATDPSAPLIHPDANDDGSGDIDWNCDGVIGDLDSGLCSDDDTEPDPGIEAFLSAVSVVSRNIDLSTEPFSYNTAIPANGWLGLLDRLQLTTDDEGYTPTLDWISDVIGTPICDDDGDGYSEYDTFGTILDCDDSNREVYPGNGCP